MKARQKLAMVMGTLLCGVLVIVLANLAWAANPTVTVTKSSESRDNTVVYRFSFTTAIAAVDTAVIYKTGTTPWYIGYMATKNVPDSCITFRLETTETTVDSCRKKVLFQISYEDSPNVTQLQHDDWYTFQSNTLDSTISDIVLFVPNRTGVPYKLRALVIETDANKDAVQTFSGEFCFPKFASL